MTSLIHIQNAVQYRSRSQQIDGNEVQRKYMEIKNTVDTSNALSHASRENRHTKWLSMPEVLVFPVTQTWIFGTSNALLIWASCRRCVAQVWHEPAQLMRKYGTQQKGLCVLCARTTFRRHIHASQIYPMTANASLCVTYRCVSQSTL